MASDSKVEFIENFKRRTKAYSIEAVSIFKALPKTEEAKIIGKQFLRSALSVGANYRAVCRARSKAEFFAKLSVTIEEADEALFWIEVLVESGVVTSEKISKFEEEGRAIIAVLSTARKNT